MISALAKEQIAELIEYVETLPLEYRASTYEAMLKQSFLQPSQAASTLQRFATSSSPGSTELVHDPSRSEEVHKHSNPALKGFLARYSLDYEIIQAVAMMDGDELVFYRHPEIRPKARATIEWALLLAFKRGVLHGEFAVSKDEIRDISKQNQCYDEGNFAKTLREAKGLFSNPFTENDVRRRLTPDGERELVGLLKKLAGQGQ